MDRGGWQELVDNLRGAEYRFGLNAAGYSLFHRVEFDAGLTVTEVIAAEGRFSFQFPPYLREFLQTALSHRNEFCDSANQNCLLLASAPSPSTGRVGEG
jgi:hypothetical protein